jgi:hypothetical protein
MERLTITQRIEIAHNLRILIENTPGIAQVEHRFHWKARQTRTFVCDPLRKLHFFGKGGIGIAQRGILNKSIPLIL